MALSTRMVRSEIKSAKENWDGTTDTIGDPKYDPDIENGRMKREYPQQTLLHGFYQNNQDKLPQLTEEEIRFVLGCYDSIRLLRQEFIENGGRIDVNTIDSFEGLAPRVDREITETINVLEKQLPLWKRLLKRIR